MSDIQICSLNVRGLRDIEKRRQMFYWLKQKSFNMFLLQETHGTPEMENIWENEWGYKICYSHGTSDSRGVAVLFRNNFSLSIHKIKADTEGRFLILDISANEYRFTLVNIYAPNEDKPEFFTNIYNELSDFPTDSLIIGGDFNCVQNISVDKQGGNPVSNPNANKEIKSIMEDLDLIDIWRQRNPDKKTFTWHQKKPLVQCRLDYFIVSYNLVSFTSDTKIRSSFKTDHSLITYSFKPYELEKGRGYWKFNASLLTDKEYIDKVKTCIRDTIENHKYLINIDDQLLWETVKLQIRGLTIQYASYLKKRKQKEENELMEKIQHLQELFDTKPSDSIFRSLNESKLNLEKIIAHKTQGAVIRAKARWYEHAEKSSKYFMNLENRHYKNKTITKLKNKNGNFITVNQEILKEANKFYSNLYTSKLSDTIGHRDTEFFPDKDVIKLDEQTKSCLDDPLTEKELAETLISMKNGKSPGLDGFPAEFYKMFWRDIKTLLLNSFNASYKLGKLSVTQRQAVLTLLPKKISDPLLIENRRPISLLNLDYKLATKTIANRVKKVLPLLINEDQTGYVQGRFIGENIRLILDLIDYTSVNHIPARLVFIDFEKAFDSLEWNFIFQTLQHFNFGPNIIKWVKVFYNDISSYIVNNGVFSEKITISRGVRQGCPLSPYLFVLCVEILANAIRKEKQIKGVCIAKSELKISQFADDTTLILDKEENSFFTALNLLEKFHHLSGLKMNHKKTEIMNIGPLKNTIKTLFPHRGFKWKKGGIRMLGITLEQTQQTLFESNYHAQFLKLSSSLARWANRKIGLRGKIAIVKSLVLSKLTYLLSVLPNPPESFINNIEKLLFQFIWDNKPDKIKRSIIINEIEEGGLKLTHMTSQCEAIKATWIQRLLNEENTGKWKLFMQIELDKIGGPLIWKFNFKKDEKNLLANISNPFLKDMVKSWSNLHFSNPKSYDDVLNQYLWHNSFIKVNNETVYYKSWVKNNILQIRDLLNDDGRFFNYKEFTDRLHKCDILKYYGIIDSIPNKWKSIIKKTFGLNGNSNTTSINPTLLTCKLAYSMLLSKVAHSPQKAKNKWHKELHLFNEMDWRNILSFPFKCTIEEKLRNFQFKLLHRILPTNVVLLKMSKVQSSYCSFCNAEPETLLHLFCDCKITQQFLSSLKHWLRKRNLVLSIQPHHIILGQNYNVIDITLEFINLMAKYYIYCCKIKEDKPLLHSFLLKLAYIEKIEKYISLYRGIYPKHTAKWKFLECAPL